MVNVVLLVTDNQSADSLGCYGSVDHETPRIDRLAREGVQFWRAFCTNGLCSPARASILTGLMPSQHGVHLAMADDDVLRKPDDYDTNNVAGESQHEAVLDALSAELVEFFATYADPRYDLWNGGRCQGLVSRYLTFKERYGPDWDMTMEVGPAFTDRL